MMRIIAVAFIVFMCNILITKGDLEDYKAKAWHKLTTLDGTIEQEEQLDQPYCK